MKKTNPELTLEEALHRLETDGRVELPGRRSDATSRWLRVRRRRLLRMVGYMVPGIVVFILGFAMDWGVVGEVVGLVGAGFTLIVLLVFASELKGRGLAAGTRRSELLPVLLDHRGVDVRGTGLLPWAYLGPPERTRIEAPAEVGGEAGGDCTLMPLTAQGSEYVSGLLGWRKNTIGPIPKKTFTVAGLRLPGIQGVSEDETFHLFTVAYERFAGSCR